MTWQSDKYKGRWEELSDFYNLNEDNHMKNLGHNLKIMGSFAIVFIIGAASAYHDGFSKVNIVEMLVAGLGAVEHALNGATK